MEIICAQSGIVPMTLSGFGIKDISQSGFKQVTLDMSLLYPAAEFDNIRKSGSIRNKKNIRIWDEPKRMNDECGLILKNYKECGLSVDLIRAPFFSCNTELFYFLKKEYENKTGSPIKSSMESCDNAQQTNLLNLLIKINTECINLCGLLNCPYILIPPVCYHASDETGKEINESYYQVLAETAVKNNVTILVGNQYLDHNGHLIRGAFSDSVKTAQFIDKLNRDVREKFPDKRNIANNVANNVVNNTTNIVFDRTEVFGFCLDTGVCNLCGQDMREYILPLGQRIKSVIIRDCDGQNDDALLPFTCVSRGRSKTDWLSLIRGLREIVYDGQLVFDFKDTASAFRPLLILPLLKLAKTVADYFAWQIGIENQIKKYKSIVLFGAGNMCRDFMKCYGEKYPPLFTCDNNSSRWGETFCGLEIKSPEELLKLPKDCGVFICNIYYNEIAKQLRRMGVCNIEFFNNEYMPSFYFENLEMWRDDKGK